MKTPSPEIALAEYWLMNGEIQKAKVLLTELTQSNNSEVYANSLLSQILTHEGNLSLESGYLDQAIHSYRLSLAKSGTSFETLHNLGLAHAQLFQYKQASQYFKEACSIEPNSFEAQINYGSCLKNLGAYDESLEHLFQAEKLNPKDARVWLNKGVTFDAMGLPKDAIQCYEKAITLDAKYLEAYTNKANAFLILGQYEEAEKSYAAALALSPSDPDTHYNLAFLQLAQGNYEHGWKNYEYRWLRENAPKKLFPTIPELTTLNEIKDKQILIWGEQGLGDTLQFSRYISALKKLGAHITLACQKELIEVLQGIDGLEKIISSGDALPHTYDAQASLMSLPFLLQQSHMQEPEAKPYITSNDLKRAEWARKLEKEKKLKVGLVWSGGFRAEQPELWSVNARRNIPIEVISKLQHIPGIQFYSLQKGEPAETELDSQHENIWPSSNLTILAKELNNFSDTAAVIENLDLVISVDTSTAHLAGALGKPVWILNRFDSCWRWLIQQEKTRWYPTATIFNQPALGDWGSVIKNVGADLRSLVEYSKK
ncbi:hypothetical protein AOC10_00665 [Polynucleobacter asymbioticus]|jgi:tetratricopeptide (TPR) repeat protein|uniref:tetratricopeptide repeat protein n=1 Tax=Polynucleobacter asymbioticus TaxID=576611 RepID=UPI0008FB9CBA|nr:tetratricopeptide repeat protein [Polynucleobacter asymbioticus]APC05145.1 hypothetical protein AOC10_00665 [Polynucleobacter asymbioticus]